MMSNDLPQSEVASFESPSPIEAGERTSSIESQTDLPSELLQGFKDIDEGRTADLDHALTYRFLSGS
jgi:hypothetical protein